MCDYSQTMSARHFCTRKAKVGDELQLIQFSYNVRGFALGRKKKWALTCLKPGTEIVFERRPVFHGMHTFVDDGNGGRIRATDMAPSCEARTALLPGGLLRRVDGVEFADGRGIGLNCLDVGTRIRVLQLPAMKRRKKKAKTEARRRELELVER